MQEADSMGIFDPKQQEAAASKELEQYEQALIKVAMAQSAQEETKVIDTSKPKVEESKEERKQVTELDEQQKAEENEFERYGDELLNKMIVEDDGSYLAEYNDVIAQISGICGLLAAN